MMRLKILIALILLRKKSKNMASQKRFVSFFNRKSTVIFLMPGNKEMFDAAIDEIRKLPSSNKYTLIAKRENFTDAENVDETILITKEVFDFFGRPKVQLKEKIAEIEADTIIDLEPEGLPEHAWISFSSGAADRVALSDQGCNSLCNVIYKSEKNAGDGNIYEKFFNFLKMF